MPLKVETEDRGPITVIRLSGNLAMGRDSQQVENTVTDLLQRGRINLVLDLAGVDGIDSTGVGMVSFTFSKVKERGGHFRVASGEGSVREVFRVTLLDTLVPFHESVDAAVASF
jgi:anti-sigma B factor antagonist